MEVKVITLTESQLDDLIRRAALAVVADLRETLHAPTREVMNKAQVAEYLGKSVATVDRLMAQGMPNFKIEKNAHPMFRKADVDAWLTKRN